MANNAGNPAPSPPPPRRAVEPFRVGSFLQGVLLGAVLLLVLPGVTMALGLAVGAVLHLCGATLPSSRGAEVALVSVVVLGGFGTVLWMNAKAGRRDAAAGVTVIAIVAVAYVASLWWDALTPVPPPVVTVAPAPSPAPR